MSLSFDLAYAFIQVGLGDWVEIILFNLPFVKAFLDSFNKTNKIWLALSLKYTKGTSEVAFQFLN